MRTILLPLRRLCMHQEGVAYLEFALVLPFLMALFLGGVETARYIIVNQKIDKVAYSMADIVGQGSTVSTADIDNLIQASNQIVQPYTLTGNGAVILTSVSQNGANPPQVRWQYPAAAAPYTSKVGATGGDATLPAGFTLNDKDNIVIAEVYYEFRPMIMQRFIGSARIYKTALYKPRLGALDTLN